MRPHQQHQTEKEESKAAEREILVTFTSSKRYHSETGNGENASVSYRLRMVLSNYVVLAAMTKKTIPQQQTSPTYKFCSMKQCHVLPFVLKEQFHVAWD